MQASNLLIARWVNDPNVTCFFTWVCDVHVTSKSNLVTAVPAAPGFAWGQNGGVDVTVSVFKQLQCLISVGEVRAQVWMLGVNPVPPSRDRWLPALPQAHGEGAQLMGMWPLRSPAEIGTPSNWAKKFRFMVRLREWCLGQQVVCWMEDLSIGMIGV